jgi:hypothetical protein
MAHLAVDYGGYENSAWPTMRENPRTGWNFPDKPGLYICFLLSNRQKLSDCYRPVPGIPTNSYETGGVDPPVRGYFSRERSCHLWQTRLAEMQALPQAFPFLQRLPNHENPPPVSGSSSDTLVKGARGKGLASSR